MGLGPAVFLMVVLSLLFFIIHKVWSPYLEPGRTSSAAQEPELKSTPEWAALADRRREIESDPLLREADKRLLIDAWLGMAQEVRVGLPPTGAIASGTTVGTRLGFLLPLVLLGCSVALAYAIGAFHRDYSLLFPATVASPKVQGGAVSSPMKDHPGGGLDLSNRVAALKVRLEGKPDDLQGWVLLARSQANLADYEGSVAALRKALELTPGHPDILADLADMVAMRQGRQLQGEPEQLIEQALNADPSHEKALALAASAAEQAGNEAKAKVYWARLSGVQQKKLIEAKPNANLQTNAQSSDPFALPVQVLIPDAAQKVLKPDSVLFVYLKGSAGPGMPLAAVRVPAAAISGGNVAITIDESSFIQPESLSQLPPKGYVQSRLAIQGTAQTQSGDWTSEWQAVSTSRSSNEPALKLQLQPR